LLQALGLFGSPAYGTKISGWHGRD
jgi:hypothetical protein